MDLSKIASFITLEPSQLFRAERCVEQGLKMYNSDEELTEAYLKEHLHGVTLNYAMHVLEESSTSYMGVQIHNQGGKFSAPTAGVYGLSSRPEMKQKIKDKVLKRNELEKKQRNMKKEEVEQVDEADTRPENINSPAHKDRSNEGLSDRQIRMKKFGQKRAQMALKKEEVEQVDELYKGKHGQTEKQYQDSRSQGGKMVSGDSKGSGAKYTHGRRVDDGGAGPQPAGGSKKPKAQGRMDTGTRNELKYRKANLMKKEEVVNEEGADSLKDRRMERGGVDGNNRYNKAPGKPNTAGKKPSSGMSAFDKVAGDLKKKYGEKAIYAKKTTKEEVVLEKKDYDGDGKIESGSKEHAGVVHNAIQRAKGKKADGKDTRKEEYVDEAITSEKGKAKASEMIAKRSTASGRAKPGQGGSVSQIKHISRSDKEGLGGTPATRSTSGKNYPKSYSGTGGTGNKAARRAGTYKEEVVSLSNSLVEGKAKCKECKGKGCSHCKGKGYMVTHNCSSKVEHAEWGSGECIKEMHTLDENGRISHYDVIFAHGIEENVSVKDLFTLVSEMHEHAINDEKNEVVESMKQARKNVGASTCWKGYKAKGTKTKDGKVVPNCVKEDEEIDEAIVELKGKKKGNVIINPEVKKVNEDADVAKKQQVQRKQLMLNKQKLALQQKATTKKKPTDMHMEEKEDIQEVDTTTRSVDYGQEIENTALKRKKEKKSLTSFKKLSKPTES